jgi:oligopeptidase B
VIAIDEPVYAVDVRGEPGLDAWPNADPAAHTYRFSYSGPRLPTITADEDVRTHAGARARERTIVKRDPVPNVDPARYATTRIDAIARDGTRVPVSLLTLRDQKPDGTHPILLGGYGAYGVPFDFAFDATLLPLVDRGVVVAIAHVRGGGDLGKTWHDGGRMQTKMNTFTDFIDCAEALVKAGWAKPGAIAIEGASAGGLLMGAVTTMRPDLWRAVLARVPFVDVVNTMLDETVPLTSNELEEWGNPKIEAQYDWLIRYSPYDHVEARAYPPMLVETSYNDSQVMYWEPAKWVAKMRATAIGASTPSSQLLLKTNMKPAGHHGLSGRYDHLRESAFRYAWVLTQLGQAPQAAPSRP